MDAEDRPEAVQEEEEMWTLRTGLKQFKRKKRLWTLRTGLKQFKRKKRCGR